MIRLILRIIYIAIMAVEAIVLARIILNIFGSTSTNVYAEWIRGISDIFINPFSGITAESVSLNSLTISLTPFVALLFYIIAAFILSELVKAFSKD